MDPIDFTAVVFGASFIAFIAVMNLVFFQPMAKLMGKRESIVGGDKDKTAECIKSYEDQVSDYETKLKEAREKASHLLNNAMEEAKQTKQGLVDEALIGIKARREASLEEIDSNKSEIINNLSSTIREISSLMVGKIMDQKLDLDLSDEAIKSALSSNGSCPPSKKVGAAV